jgi:diguanylate cyclase (GGDEF)-like protein
VISRGSSHAAAKPFINAAMSEIPASETRASTQRMRILLIDDNPAIHEDFHEILRPATSGSRELGELKTAFFGRNANDSADAEARAFDAELELDSAHQGEQGIALAAEAFRAGRPYQLAFVDVCMPPGLDGIETIARLWELDPRLQVVVCSDYSDHTWADIVRRLGHSDCLLVLRKPFDAIEVLQLAHSLTRKWALAEAVQQRLAELEETVRARTNALEETNRILLDQVDQRNRAEQDLQHLSTHDPLTSVPNRAYLRERMTAALARAQRTGRSVALVLLDLDHFKDVNDAYGHQAGDELLLAVADRLRGCVRASDVVARVGGDEFVLLLDDIGEPEEAAIVAERVLRCCSRPFLVAGQEVHTPPSMGIALYPSDCSAAEDLLKCADLAMYEAKESGRAAFRYYADGMLESSQEKLRLREQLMRALDHGELRVFYQPLVDLETGAVSAMEALVRWQHPELGLVPPIKFIPAAEKSGLIVAIGTWVLRTACKQLGEWRRAGADLAVAVNVSAREVQAPDFLEVVTEAIASAGIEPHQLELELTETSALKDPEKSAAVLGKIAALGVRLAIDDFGSGYSSLMRLRQMPISVLKIDRFFVQNIATNPRDAAIVAAVVAMAHSLGLTVVVEGVETRAQLLALQTLDTQLDSRTTCDRIQGYLLSKPLPSDAATELLRQNSLAPLQLTGS